MKNVFLLVLLIFSLLESESKDDLKYPVSAIPEQLKSGASVVVREDVVKFKILAKNRAAQYVHFVVTIFNENGKEYASHDVGYDKLTKIQSLNAVVYDATGKVIKRLRDKEIIDHAYLDGFTLFSDDRVKSIDLAQPIYPYTVEVEYELELKFLYSIPSMWLTGPNVSYQHVMYELSYWPEIVPRYKVFNIKNSPQKRTEGGFETLTWTFENVISENIEPLSPYREEITPHILAAPSTFEYDGYLGDMSTWQEYGKWQLKLNSGRDQLSEATRAKVRELTKGRESIETKARVLYEFLQSKTRYVNIAEGIGGLQPFPASVVDDNGYGDCKALSNFMVALLKEAGVKAYYTKIYAGEHTREIQADFSSHQTNHIVVAVPNANDTIWLECTSQTNPFGYQGRFTGDRKALMITEQGGVVVNTLRYSPEQNLQSRIAEVNIDETGNAKAKIKTKYKGLQYENDNLNWALSSTEKQKKWIEKNTEIPNFNINSFSMREVKDKIPSATVRLDLTLNRYASTSGKRLFVTPNLMNRVTSIPERMTERKTDVVTKSNFIDLDTIIYSIPENLYPEFLPQPTKITSKFGEYETNFKFEAGKVIYTRRLKMWKGRFPKETYNELVDFYKNVSKSDNTKLVFLNKT